MNFFKNIFWSILGLFNSENQQRRNSPCGLALIFTIARFESPATVLESVAVKPTSFVSATGSDISIRRSTGGDVRPVDLAGDIRAGLDRFTTLTESIGFESGDLTVSEVLPSPLMGGARKRGTMRREEVIMGGKRKTPPPMLSTLKENGRPRFNLRKVRKDGRLQISKVPNDRPEVVRITFPKEGRMKIRFVSSDEEEEDSSSSSEDGQI